MGRVISALLILVGLINVFPVVGLVSSDVLSGLYGIADLQGDLLILMRHRALLFGILGTLILVSALKRNLQPVAIATGLVSMLGFIVLTLSAGDYGAKLLKIVWVDVVASIALVAVLFLRARKVCSRKLI